MSFVKVDISMIMKIEIKKGYILNTSIGVEHTISLFTICLDFDICMLRVGGLQGSNIWSLSTNLAGRLQLSCWKINAKQGRDYSWVGYLKKKDIVIISVCNLGVHKMFTITCLANWVFSYSSWFRCQNHMLPIIMDFSRAQSYSYSCHRICLHGSKML